MGRFQTFESFLAGQGVEISIWGFLVNLALAALLSYLLGLVYVRYSTALSNRRAFAGNFMLLTTTTTLIIAIVKSSLALSLGLVGALSIVRFRAAIKEPEELTYLFFAIAIGLGLGADQRQVTLIAFAVIVAIIALKNAAWKTAGQPNLYLTISSQTAPKLALDDVVRVLETHCSDVDLRRFDEDGELLEASFVVNFDRFDEVGRAVSALQRLNEDVKVSFLDQRGAL